MCFGSLSASIKSRRCSGTLACLRELEQGGGPAPYSSKAVCAITLVDGTFVEDLTDLGHIARLPISAVTLPSMALPNLLGIMLLR